MALNPGLELPFGIQPTNSVPVDAYAGPYSSVAEANAAIPLAVRYQGMEVIIITGGQADKYTYKAGTADINLVPFSAGTTYTFTEGLTETAGTVALGGDITGVTELIVDSFIDASFSIIDNGFFLGFGMWPDFGTVTSPFEGGLGVGFFLQGSTDINAFFDGGAFNIGAGAVLNIGNLAGAGTRMLTVDNLGTVSAQAIPTGTPAGANGQVQYNNAGAFGAEASFTYNSVSDELSVGNILVTGANGVELTATDAQIVAAENLDITSNVAASTFTITSNFSTVAVSALAGVGTRMVVADASGILSTQAIPAGGSPAGANTQVQYNNGGAFGASANLTFNSGTNVLQTVSISAQNITATTQLQSNSDAYFINNTYFRTQFSVSSPNNAQHQLYVQSQGTNVPLPNTVIFTAWAGITTAFSQWLTIRTIGDFSSGPQTKVEVALLKSIIITERTADALNGVTLARVGERVGFYGTTPITKPTISGSRGGNAALASLITALANMGLVTDSTTA